MAFLSSLFAWGNVPFTVALSIAVGFALLQASGLLGLLAGDHDGDHDADHDGDADADADHDGEDFSVTGLLGVGRIPLSLVWQTFATSFGVAGIATNTLVNGLSKPLATYALLWSVPIALIAAFAVTAIMARVAGRIFSTEGQEATTRVQLVGTSGVVISSKIDGEFGEVRLRDRLGHTVRVVCTTSDDKPIKEGAEVVVVEYDRERDRLVVSALDADDRVPEKRGPA